MRYKLTIVREKENANYQAELEKWNNNSRGFNSNDPHFQPQPFIEEDTLNVELTPEQFSAVRKAALETF